MTHLATDNTFSEEYLTQRFMRQPRQTQKIQYEFTQDVGLLHQYHRLREEMLWGLKHFTGQPDAFDDKSQILVAKRGRQCLAGVRFAVSNPPHANRLPMEGNDLSLHALFPELNLAECTYGEVSRLAILPEFRTDTVFTEIARHLIKEAIKQDVEYVFSISPQPTAHGYRHAVQMFGLKWDVRHDIIVPDRAEYEGIKMALSVMSLTPYVRGRKSFYQPQRESVLAD